MPRVRVLLDLTHVYDEEGGVEEIGADPNLYSDEAPPSGDPPPFRPSYRGMRWRFRKK